jgi:hypothetical protein
MDVFVRPPPFVGLILCVKGHVLIANYFGRLSMTRILLVRASVLTLCTILAAFSSALAVPYSYEFTSGGLTGSFTAEAELTSPPTYAFQSWHITPPSGPVWDSGNPNQLQFDNFNQGGSLSLALFIQPGYPNFGLSVDNLGELLPNSVSGTYSFLLVHDPFTRESGSGDWIRSVPGPNTLWSLGFGLLALPVVEWLRRRPAA